jgi:cobalt-zinc-cadmium efflux system outer membrane protein
MAVKTARRNVVIMMFALSLGACYRQPEPYMEAPSIAPASEQPAEASEPRIIDPVSSPQDSSYRDSAPYVDGLTLGEAVRRSLRFNPAVQAAGLEIDARRAEILQAGLRPNPELGGQAENIGQTGQDATIELSQLFELGGKRVKRVRVAELDVGVAAWDFEAARLRVASNTAQSFIDVLVAQERLKILDDLQVVAENLGVAVDERVRAGNVSPVEAQRTQIEVTRAKAQLNEERARLTVTKRLLANYWGSQSIDFGSVRGELTSTNHIPSAEQISIELASNPDIARWAEEMIRRKAVLELARANAVPDLRLGAGAKRLEEPDETGAVVSLSVPLPLFNRNQGNIAAAETRIFKGQRESLSATTDVNAVFLEAYSRLVASAERLKALEKEILPAAKEVYEATMKGYSAGEFDLLSILDAQRTLFGTRLEIVNARGEFHKAKAQIEALIGRGLNEL